ncbi:hypothetical protein ACIP9X_14320 [Arthrobacter sp. NPDC093125]|uniref:hypothetical protein n=1 Tax=Arthrobacter sp. NPDC093125 TaxID=3363944 RepID=UPI003818DE94
MDTSYTQTSRPTHYGYRRPVVTSWCELTPGDTIVLLGPEKGKARITGMVDAISADGSLMWLLQDNCAGRRMFHQPDGYKTLLDPRPA